MTAPVPYLLDDNRLSPGQKMARQQQQNFNAPHVEPNPVEPRLLWQQQDQNRQAKQEEWLQKTKLIPVADSITPDTFTNRNNDIRQMGQSATAGAVASANYQRQQNELQALRGFQDQQTQAMMQAYSMYNGIAGSMRPKVSPTGGLSAGGSYSGDVSYDGTDASIADMMRKAGFPEDQIGIGLGVVQAESNYKQGAQHYNSNGSIDQGLFQINSIHKARYAGQDIYDPQTNVNIAYQVWKDAGGSWKPWVTYQQGLASAHSVPATRLVATPSVTGGIVTTGNGTIRNQIIQAAMPVLNLPYVWGGDSMKYGVDCSGLVQQVYKQVLGWNVPRQARAQAVNGAVGTRVGSYNELQPGDLVAFQWAGGYAGAGTVSHIAIYMGGGKIIEAAGGSNGDIRSLGNSAQDRGAIYIKVRMPGE